VTDAPLAFDDAFELLGPALPGDTVVLVGGQAVNYWLSYYRERDSTLAEIGVVTSDDVDFFGMSDAAARMASAIKGSTIATTSFDDAGSPNTAIVIFHDRHGRERRIDFLRLVHGLKSEKRIRDTAVVVELKDLQGQPTGIELRVLHPVLCLESRVHNTHTFTRYQTPRALRQARAAIACARGYVTELCDRNEIRAAHRAIKVIGELAAHPAGSRVFKSFGLDVFEAIPLDDRLGVDCLTKNIPLLRRRAGRAS
jgi:hypothetical protein